MNLKSKQTTKVDDLALPGKKGICFVLKGSNGAANLAKLNQLKLYWNYGWTSERVEDQPANLEFIPQVWGGAKSDELMLERLKQQIQPQIEAGLCKRILAFNEPDKKEQSNMTVERCLHFWPLLEQLGVPICSPSCENPLGCDNAEDCNQGVHGHWMTDFMNQLEEKDYRCDYLGAHWYGGPSFDAFKNFMRKVYDSQGGKYPLLITEFAVADWKAMNKSCADNRYTQKQVLEFMKKALPWIEQQEWIVGYAWFPFDAECSQGTCSALFTKQGNMTALGRFYASVSKEEPNGNQDEKVWEG